MAFREVEQRARQSFFRQPHAFCTKWLTLGAFIYIFSCICSAQFQDKRSLVDRVFYSYCGVDRHGGHLSIQTSVSTTPALR